VNLLGRKWKGLGLGLEHLVAARNLSCGCRAIRSKKMMQIRQMFEK